MYSIYIYAICVLEKKNCFKLLLKTRISYIIFIAFSCLIRLVNKVKDFFINVAGGGDLRTIRILNMPPALKGCPLNGELLYLAAKVNKFLRKLVVRHHWLF